MVIKKTRITRFISAAAAAVCLSAGLNFAPFTMEIEAADQLTAFEITEEMQLGWNLGNTLDSYMSKNNEPIASCGLEAETCWGNPKTTQAMIDAVKAKGFNTIRVPVTWFQHVDVNNGYKIDDAWMARVKEIVDYCYNSDMYVILNLHHEEPYVNRSTLGADYEELTGYVSSLWKQIAETFKDYDQRLVFEIMNEPRAKNTDHEWWGPTKEETDTINKINADALEVIRGTGDDNNDTRLVMMPGYCASSDTSMMSKIVVPDDDFVAVSVHAYSPYNFTMNAEVKDHSTFTAAYATELTSILDGIRKTFGDKDIPVVLGEFSASNFGNTEARIEWAEAYISQTKAMGIPCVLWDNNVEKNNGGEAHGYLNRSALTWYEGSETVVDTMVKIINDDSIVWGSARKSPVIEHEDITTGVQLLDKAIEIDAALAPDGNCTPGLNATWAQLEGGDVAIKYTGDQPVIAVVDDAWDNWTEIKAYDDRDGIAYYSAEHIKAAWAGEPSDIAHLFARTNSVTSIEAIAIIGGAEVGEPPEDTAKIFKLDLSERDDSDQMLMLVFKGKAGSTINGCVGYMGAEWTNIEYEGKIGSDGTFSVEVPLFGKDITSIEDIESGIPAGIKSAEAQIWWCDDEEGTLAEYSIKGLGVPPVEDPTDEPTEEPSVNVPETPVSMYGDANCDNKVTMADAATIYQALGNADKYALSEQGAANADVNGVLGITADDALTIQKVSANLIVITDLPLKASK